MSHTTLGRRALTLTIATFVLLAGAPVGATERHPAALLNALRGVDTLPTPAHLRRAAPDKTAQRLAAIAADKAVSPWLRVRAVSVMPGLGAEAAGPLLGLSEVALPPRVRWWAVYGWLRYLAPKADQGPKGAATLARAQRWLADGHWRVREAAARALGWQRGTQVDRALRERLAIEPKPAVKSALRRALERPRR